MNQPENFKMTPESKQHYLDLLEKQRQFLASLNKDPQLDEGLLREQIYQICRVEETVKII